MLNFVLVILSALLVIAADAIIKYASKYNGWVSPLLSPVMMLCYLMYFIQIIAALAIFKSKGSIAIYTNLFVVFYAIFGVLAGVFLFGESITGWKYLGIALAMAGAYILYS